MIDMEAYSSIQQLKKVEPGEVDGLRVYPPTVIQAVHDAKTGASLEAVLAQYNNIYVPYQGSPKDTRNIVPMEMRRAGLMITYMNLEGETVTERASSAVNRENGAWGDDSNWSTIDELSLGGEISVSAGGTWIIGGVDTKVAARGPKGENGISPLLKTIDNKLHYSYDGVEWKVCSENIAAWFRWSGNKIQISRDNKTWSDLSGTFADNVHIKGYVSAYSSLPSSAAQGDIYGVGPTYAEEDTEQTNPIYRYYVRNAGAWVDNGSFTSISAGVVQETGDSETEVMSQKAVTEKLSELGSEVGLKKNYSVLYNRVVDTSINKLMDTTNWNTILVKINPSVRKIVVNNIVCSTYNIFSNSDFSASSFLGRRSDGGILVEGGEYALISVKISDNQGADYNSIEVVLYDDYAPNLTDRNARILYNTLISIETDGTFTYRRDIGYDVLLVTLTEEGIEDVVISGITDISKKFAFSGNYPSEQYYIGYDKIPVGTKLVGFLIYRNESDDYRNIGVKFVKEEQRILANEYIAPYVGEVYKSKNLIDKDNLLFDYVISGGNVVESKGAVMSNKLYLVNGESYAMQGIVAYGSSSKIYIALYGENDNYIGRISLEPTSIDESRKSSATYRFDNFNNLIRYVRVVLGTSIYPFDSSIAQIEQGNEPSEVDNNFSAEVVFSYPQKEVKLLCIGNSYSQDALCYVPYFMKSIAPDVNVTIGILYLSGAVLSQHLDNFKNSSPNYIYYKFSKENVAWETVSSACTIQDAMSDEEWNMVLLHQGSIASITWSTYQPYLNELIDLIYSKTSSSVKIGWMLTQSRPKVSDTVYTDGQIMEHYASIAENARRVMNETPCEFIFPVGTAVENARTTTLKSIGHYGKLCSADGGHLQEGLPCQLAAYTCTLKLLELIGESKSVYGDDNRVDAAWVLARNIPGQNGTATGSTDYNCRLAQKCAIMAVKHPYEVTDVSMLGDYHPTYKLPMEITDGSFFDGTGVIKNNNYMKTIQCNIMGMDAIVIDNFSLSSDFTGVPCWMFLDTDGNVVSIDTTHDGPMEINDICVTIPLGAVYLSVNCRQSKDANIYKGELVYKDFEDTREQSKFVLYDKEPSSNNLIFYIRSSFNNDKDIVVKYWVNKNGIISPHSTYIGNKTLKDTDLMTSVNLISTHSDSTAPLFSSSVWWHLFAQHGYVIPVLPNVGMTDGDVGAMWKDQMDREYIIGQVTDSQVYLLPFITKDDYGNETRGWRSPFDTKINSLVHMSGGVYTDDIIVDDQTTTQLCPIMNHADRKFIADGHVIDKAGVYYFDELKVSETQIGYDPASVRVWFPTPELSGANEMARFTWSYNFKGANCCVNTTIDIRSKVECKSYGATQQETFFDTGDYKAMFIIPKAKQQNGVDLDKPFNSASSVAPSFGFYRTEYYLKNVDDPIDRLVAYLHNPSNNSYLAGMAAGLSLVSGDTVRLKRIASMPVGYKDSHYRLGSFSPSNKNKFYIAAVNSAEFEDDNYHFPTTYFKEINYYVSYFDPSENVGQVYWYKDGSKYVVYMHCQTEQNKLAINLPDFMEGLKVELVEKTEGAKLLTDVIQNGKLYVNYNGDANYIVVKTV